MTVTPASGDTNTATVSGALTFTAVGLGGRADCDGQRRRGGFRVGLSQPSSGGDYGANNVAADSVTVTVAARGVIVDPQTLDVVAGATNTYTIVLGDLSRLLR